MTRSIKRRRLEARTDYKARLALLKSEMPRVVVRKTNRYIIAQIVKSDIAQDTVVVGLTSKSLISKGWPEKNTGSLKSIPAAYLTGLLLGTMAKGKVKEAVLDIGMHRNIQKSRIYAVLKGVTDSGLKVPHAESTVPPLDKIDPKLADAFKKVKEKIK